MPFITLFNMYCAFMEGNSIHHEELITPICVYAKSVNQSASDVLSSLINMYQRV